MIFLYRPMQNLENVLSYLEKMCYYYYYYYDTT